MGESHKPSWQRTATGRRITRLTGWWFFVGGLAVLKICLMGGESRWEHSPHDATLYLRLAQAITSGRALRDGWLGSYDNLTLVKEPFYPVWLAGIGKLGLPRVRAEQGLYALACIVLVAALRSQARRSGALLAGYLLLLFNPMSYYGRTAIALRETIYPALVLLVFACATGLYASCHASLWRFGAWGVCLGVSFAAFWLTREEGVWLMPFLCLLLAYTAWTIWHTGRRDRTARLALLAAPLGIWGAADLSICLLNRAGYGIFTTSELKETQFCRAYGALMRVRPARWVPNVPLPRESRLRLYRHSPSFGELRPYLEGEIGAAWVANSAAVDVHATDIIGGMAYFALRDAAQAAGHHRSAVLAQRYYARLADEVNQACDAGVIDSGPPRASLVPAWRGAYAALVAKSSARLFVSTLTFQGCLPPVGASGPWAGLQTGVPRILAIIYRYLGPAAFLGSAVALLIGLAGAWRRRRLDFLLYLALVTAAALLVRVALVGFVDVALFPVLTPRLLTSAHVLLLLLIAVVLVAATNAAQSRGPGRPEGAALDVARRRP